MPSLRKGLHSSGCPLETYKISPENEAAAAAATASARAVSFYAGIEAGQEPSDPQLRLQAQRCAERILAGECQQWQFIGKKNGFVLKND